ncbi:MAG TPA: hypothetical protein VK524_04855 [Polyangiaceae bacterium]|nr:hypothetical protein [Polyangiaceae bacterium]
MTLLCGAVLGLASSCALTAPSDAELMGESRPNRVDSGASEDAAPEAGAADSGADAAKDAAPPLTCAPACSAKQVCAVQGGSPTCSEPAAAIDGATWEIPCGEIYGTQQWNCRFWPAGSTSCPAQGYTPVDRRIRFGGQANVTYDVTLRFRGIVEPKIYAGGTADGPFYIGGGPAANSENYNSYGFTVSDPLTSYYLNYAENKGDYVFAFEHEKTLPIKGQTEIRLFAFAPTCGGLLNCQDFSTAPACTPYPVPGGPPAYNGHFIQMDVVAVKRR